MPATVREDRSRLARELDAAVRRLQAPGVRASRILLRRALRAVQAAYAAGDVEGWPFILRGHIERFEKLLRDALVGSHIAGGIWAHEHGLHTGVESGVSGGFLFRTQPADIYERAAELAVQHGTLSAVQVAALQESYGAIAAKAAVGFNDAVEAKVRQAVAVSVVEGLHVREGIAAIRKAFEAAGAGPISPHLAETLFRTRTQMAFSAARALENQDPDIDAIIWGYEYVSILSATTRPTHAAYHGSRWAKDDPEWPTVRPPNGYNCKCQWLEIFDTDDVRLRRSVPPPEMTMDARGNEIPVRPDPGFAFDPADVYGSPLRPMIATQG